jgi:hypothetical protein
MRYLTIFASTVLLTLAGYISLIPILGPTPVVAEYWVNELLVIKRDLVKKLAHTQKLIIASGSSTLFSVDTSLLTQALHVPVVNLGMMGGMPLERILAEADAASNPNDTVILALEPEYYCRVEISDFDEWVLRNAIAWDYVYWNKLSFLDRLSSVRVLGLKFPLEMLQARFDSAYRPEITKQRLFALNEEAVLNKFASAPKIPEHLYSMYSMDTLGNIKNTTDSSYTASPTRADAPLKICAQSLSKISAFIQRQKSKGVSVFFIHTPYVQLNDLNLAAVALASKEFANTLSPLAPVLDVRADVLFERNLFLNSALHLNSIGRELRTQRLIPVLRDRVLSK